MYAKLAVGIVPLALIFGIWSAVGHGAGQESKAGSSPTADGNNRAAPEFTQVTDWVNSKPLKIADLHGKVTVIHFWTSGCINCIHNYPHYRAWTAKYGERKDFVIVGIHTPEFGAEKDVALIRDRAAKNRLTFPIAVDNAAANWKAWGNRYWPCIYLVDKAGIIRHRWEGELGDDEFRKVTGQIEELLAEKK
jgi:thiol-disulfide isomerase/thioredoxin